MPSYRLFYLCRDQSNLLPFQIMVGSYLQKSKQAVAEVSYANQTQAYENLEVAYKVLSLALRDKSQEGHKYLHAFI